MRAASAGYDDAARARWAPEPPKRAGRSDFERDRARVLHSAALRRLAAKTQVVVPGENDFPRTRLTHSLECAQIGRELGGALGCDPDLVDAACLAHDLGHPPFGHNGEAALDEAAAPCGGFEGNAQSLRLLTRLEAKVFRARPDAPVGERSAGLNLTRATLDAATKYPWTRRGAGGTSARKYGVYAEDLEVFTWLREGAPARRPCLEAQVMDWSDDIAYSVHDFEDAVHAGALPLPALRDPHEQREITGLCQAGGSGGSPPAEVDAAWARLLSLPCWPARYDGSLRDLAALKNLTSELIGRFARAAEQATRAAHAGPLARYAADLVVPPETRLECELLKAVANRYVMTGEAARRRYARQRGVVLALVGALCRRAPAALDATLRPEFIAARDDAGRLRVVIDQVALLTDTSARALRESLPA